MIELNGRLRLHESFRHETVRVGTELAPVLVVDNFLSDPQVLIDYAATAGSFVADDGTFYPGVRAVMPPIYTFAVRAFLGHLIAAAFGLGGRQVAKELSHFSLLTTRPEGLQPLQRLPHFDNTDPLQLAVLHYLSPVAQGGTSFYRHRTSGFESMRTDRLAAYSALLDAEVASAGLPPPAYIHGDTPLFERLTSFDGVFNRLLVYRSISLHSADVAPDFRFDTDARTGRLTANTFFYYR
ncbi:MAG TPA: DUF6445 family protein [Steroidobacteraceae bacterium]|jgi:Family of unknown function (DUF6445)